MSYNLSKHVERTPGLQKIKRFLTPAPGLRKFVAIWVLLTVFGVVYDTSYSRYKVTGEIPGDFPVLVISSSANADQAAKVVQYDKLEEYTKNLKNHSYIVSPGKEKELQEQIAPLKYMNGKSGPARFEKEQITKTRQRIKVVLLTDTEEHPMRVVTSWYIAEPDRIVPQYYRSIGIPMIAAIFWAPFTLVATQLIIWLMNMVRRFRK